LAPAPDIIEAHLAYCRWHVAELLRIGASGSTIGPWSVGGASRFG
jgi:hypothetical protein